MRVSQLQLHDGTDNDSAAPNGTFAAGSCTARACHYCSLQHQTTPMTSCFSAQKQQNQH